MTIPVSKMAVAGLVIGSAPFAVLLVLAARVSGPATERAAWSVLTVWLGRTYLQTGAACRAGPDCDRLLRHHSWQK